MTLAVPFNLTRLSVELSARLCDSSSNVTHMAICKLIHHLCLLNNLTVDHLIAIGCMTAEIIGSGLLAGQHYHHIHYFYHHHHHYHHHYHYHHHFHHYIYTAISRKVVGENVHATIPKGNMGYDRYTVPDTVAVEPTFVAFF